MGNRGSVFICPLQVLARNLCFNCCQNANRKKNWSKVAKRMTTILAFGQLKKHRSQVTLAAYLVRSQL
jgi:hypothetical protein